jgi:ABC-2 type transport system ATP-binding protein/lipopolysaccharide transport system ATP-binding protein
VRALPIGYKGIIMASVILESVSVDFPIYNINARSLKKQFIRLTTGGALNNDETHKCVTVKALDNISLQLEHGDRVGLIGHNGAGKSTLLRVLAQIYEPTSGHIHFDGKVSPLLDVMLGINQESSGYENIILRGLLLGLTRKEIMSKAKQIAEFTELGDYLSMPVRTYSSGMQLRLAFGVATSINPEILLLDEVVGTGDAAFMVKAEQRFNELIAQSSIVILASHSNDVIKRTCNKVILLEAGKVKYFGSVDEAFSLYK